MRVHTRMTSSTSCSTRRMAEPLGGEALEQVGEQVGLGLAQAGRRLVEQQRPRLGGQGPADLHEPGQPGGQRIDARRRPPP